MRTILTVIGVLCAATALPQGINAVEANVQEEAKNPFAVANTALKNWISAENGPAVPRFNAPKKADFLDDDKYLEAFKAHQDQNDKVNAAEKDGPMLAYKHFSAAMDQLIDMQQPQNSATNPPALLMPPTLTDAFTITKNAYTARKNAADLLLTPSSSQKPADIIARFDERINEETGGIKSEEKELGVFNAAFEQILAGADTISDNLKKEITAYQTSGSYIEDNNWLENMKSKLKDIDQNVVEGLLHTKNEIFKAMNYIDRNHGNIHKFKSAKESYIEHNKTIQEAVNFILESLENGESSFNNHFAQ
jgi:hypothetical protein